MKLDFSGKIEQDVTIETDTVLMGMIVGNVTVKQGATFLLRGMVVGNVRVLKGAHLDVPGTIVGEILNEGGKVNTTGLVIKS